MDGMDMSGMGGMDMGSSGLFTGKNKAIAHGFWYAIAGVTVLFTIKRILSYAQSRQRLRLSEQAPQCVSSRPRGWWSQAYATATAALREAAYPQPWYFTGSFSRYFTPLPVGRWLILLVYWTVILAFLWSNTILKPSDPSYAYKWEKVGFRAAWVSVTQIPFIFLLSTKFNPFSLLTGISYERLNWLHRWASRTVFLTVIVHWSFFFKEWVLADFVQLELEMMPMVKYGFGAFAVLGWTLVSSFGYFRAKAYELFVAQHICAAAVLLWLLHSHVPSYAKYNVYLSIAFLAFDWGVRLVWGLLRNFHLLGRMQPRMPGYSATLEPLPGDMVRMTIEDADFSWTSGQHVYLSMPRLRPFEVHPFTIANAPQTRQGGNSSSLTLVIKAHKGFSKSLHKAAITSVVQDRSYKAFLSGPWGMPPNLLHYDTVVLIAASSGASFIVPMLESLVRSQNCVRKVHLHWIIRSEEHFAWFSETLMSLTQEARNRKMSLQITVHITQSVKQSSQVLSEATSPAESPPALEAKQKQQESVVSTAARSGESSSGSSLSASIDEKSTPSSTYLRRHPEQLFVSLNMQHGGRPKAEAIIRQPVEAALGETAVVVCGGGTLTAEARTFVATLSDERSVHKGTGAQGIFLFTETYGW
ncbi:hypothetical protein B0A50_02741 [Salinomyces thailandicus]|uniref:ferric-chelate reductase (NADPH) n=1 Tax=Salinomyces thailandicus TaxID=706561 RepID=A0A4U0U5Z0_9PEZI|nr:hypothetical protein B0A50_02741 [Salinomyces thailandica]